MKKPRHLLTLWVLIFLFCLAGSGWAFLFEVPILSKEQIVKLSDRELEDKFLDAVVELEAVETFYCNSGFTPREYAKLKALLKYRVLLLQEMSLREIEPLRIP
jgi:hypothetical protein